MFRLAVQSARCAARTSARQQTFAARPVLSSSFVQHQRFTPIVAARGYAAGSGLSQQEVTGRIMDLLKGFDKIKDTSKLAETSSFTNDLGLDSLDTVEVVMAIEEEFSIEIPDKEADAINSVEKAVNYILSQPDAH